MTSPMNVNQTGRKVNQKCAFAQALLNFPEEYFQDFAGQALVEAAYLEMEQALSLHVAEELSRFGHAGMLRSGLVIDRAWLELQVQSSLAAGVLVELRRLFSQKDSWATRLLAVCDNLRAIPGSEKSLKSDLFVDEEALTSSAGLIRTVTPSDTDGKLDRFAAVASVQELLDFIARHRSSDEEY